MFAKSQDNAEKKSSPLSGAETAVGNNHRSVLREGITIKGEWTSEGIVDFGGTFEGDLAVDTLVLAKTGKIKGNVTARNVTIEGVIDGTISARSVVLKTSAQVNVDIFAQNVTVDHGARIEGHVVCNPNQTHD